ncbi:unnamed protein product [Rangifer tarandus platyrhynchus]|uniref:Uncharacterized protein n=1 Tax=Rangifer tarandus platyrhynchus TaxID=3082113 RepID=A0ABN8XI81_RANTA|nr:unnamed protein product [Rangifer tarandus platyrhynchus]
MLVGEETATSAAAPGLTFGRETTCLTRAPVVALARRLNDNRNPNYMNVRYAQCKERPFLVVGLRAQVNISTSAYWKTLTGNSAAIIVERLRAQAFISASAH